MVKVDADCVLCRDDFLERVVALFEQRPNVQLLEVKLFDWYTQRRMSGINAYRRSIAWRSHGEHVFNDHMEIPKAAIYKDRRDLAPAAVHCPDPLPWQAFHFGVHRGVKAAVATARGMHDKARLRQRELEWTWKQFKRNPDPRLGLACLGGEWGLQGRFDDRQLDYGNSDVRAAFKEVAPMPAAKLRDRVERLRRADHGALPWFVRHELRRGGLTLPLRLVTPLPLRVMADRARRRLVSSGG